MNRIKKFWNDHYEAIIVGTGVAVLGGYMTYMVADNVRKQGAIVGGTVGSSFDPEGKTEVLHFQVNHADGSAHVWEWSVLEEAAKTVRSQIKAEKTKPKTTKPKTESEAFDKLLDAAKDMDDAVAASKGAAKAA